MDAKVMAQKILQGAGGKNNVKNLTRCATRPRFSLRSTGGIGEKKVGEIPGVMGVVNRGGQFQVVIGQEAPIVHQELQKLGGCGTDKAKDGISQNEKKKEFNVLLDTIADIFSPIMPIIAGVGIAKALLSIPTLFSPIDRTGNAHYFLDFIADASYYFLPVFSAASTTKKFGRNMQMVMLVGAALLHPNLIVLKETGDIVRVLGIPVCMVTYSSSVVPVIIIIFVLLYVGKSAEKTTPAIIRFIARPLLTILIIAPIGLVVLGLLGNIIGDSLVAFLLSVEKIAPWVLPTVIGIFMPFLVVTDIHYSLLPACANSLSALGHGTVIGPGNLPSNIAQGVAAFCVVVKIKNEGLRQLSVSSSVTAPLGTTKSTLFGANLRLHKPLAATTTSEGIGGLYAGLTGVQRFGGGGADLAATGLYVGPDSRNVINALTAAFIVFVMAFVIQWHLGFEDVPEESGAKEETGAKEKSSGNGNHKLSVSSPLDGDLIPLSQVNNQVFSSGMLGIGVAVRPWGGKLYAPVNDTVASMFDIGYVLGIVAGNSAGLLIHVGMDTVELQGKYFRPHVKAEDRVKTGDMLLTFDKEAIEKEGYETVTPVIVSNSTSHTAMCKGELGMIRTGGLITTVE